MGQILRRLAMVSLARSILLSTVVLLLSLTAITGCGGGEDEPGDSAGGGQQEAMEEDLSQYIQPTDSLRWLNYLAYNPEDTALAYVMLASMYLTNEYPRAALHYLDRASFYDLDRPVIYLNMGYAYNMLGEYEQATEAFQMFVQRDPGSILSQEIFRIVEKYRAISNQPPE